MKHPRLPLGEIDRTKLPTTDIEKLIIFACFSPRIAQANEILKMKYRDIFISYKLCSRHCLLNGFIEEATPMPPADWQMDTHVVIEEPV